MTKWVLSPLAEVDLESILEFIVEQSQSSTVANKVLADFGETFDLLARMPKMGHQREHLTGQSIRWWRLHSYLLVYDSSFKPLRILRIIHGARDLNRFFQRNR